MNEKAKVYPERTAAEGGIWQSSKQRHDSALCSIAVDSMHTQIIDEAKLEANS